MDASSLTVFFLNKFTLTLQSLKLYVALYCVATILSLTLSSVHLFLLLTVWEILYNLLKGYISNASSLRLSFVGLLRRGLKIDNVRCDVAKWPPFNRSVAQHFTLRRRHDYDNSAY